MRKSERSTYCGDKMKVTMLTKLACPLGVFNPGDTYENNEAACRALIADDCAYDPKEPGPKVETAEAVAPKETAAKRTTKPRRGRPRKTRKKK